MNEQVVSHEQQILYHDILKCGPKHDSTSFKNMFHVKWLDQN